MWGDGAYGEVAYGESQDGTIPPFQDRRVFAEIGVVVSGAGAQLDPGVGDMELRFVATAVGLAVRPKVRSINTNPASGRGNTKISHTGLI